MALWIAVLHSGVSAQPDFPIQIDPRNPVRNTLGSESSNSDQAQLVGQWIVRFVRRDGERNAAQIGQAIDDIITVKKDGEQFSFG